MIKVDEEAIPDERIPRTVPPRERNAFSTGSKTDGGSPLRSDVAFSITKGPLMILEGERGTKKKRKKKKEEGKRERSRVRNIFRRERERESRYHLNQVASISYCTCHLWQRWHRFLPRNLHHPLLGSDLRINHPFFFFLPSIRANFSLRPNSPVLYFCREFPPRKAYNN